MQRFIKVICSWNLSIFLLFGLIRRLNETKKYNHIQLVAHCESIHIVIRMEYHRNYKRSKKATGILKKRLVPVPVPTPEIVVKKVSQEVCWG